MDSSKARVCVCVHATVHKYGMCALCTIPVSLSALLVEACYFTVPYVEMGLVGLGSSAMSNVMEKGGSKHGAMRKPALCS